MKKNYEIAGMSYGGCVNGVKWTLLQNTDVEEADVQLNPQRVGLTLNRVIGVKVL